MPFKFTFFVLASLLVLHTGRAQAACDCSWLPSLNQALKYPAMSLSEDITIAGAVWAENGFVGLGNEFGNNGTVTVNGSSAVLDEIHHHPSTTVTINGGSVNAVVERDMSAEVAAVHTVSNAFAMMPATQTFTRVRSTTTVTGNGCINVIRVTDIIDLGGNRTLTFVGTYDDYFIVNVENGVFLSGNAEIILDGVEPNHVMFNVTGVADVDLQGTAAVNGTYISTRGEIEVSGNASNRGAYYAGLDLTLNGGALWYGEPFECTTGICPDPEDNGVNIQRPATPGARSTGNAPFYHSYFDTATFEGHLESFKLNVAGVVMDANDDPAVDPSTNLLESTRVPFWDAGVELRSNSSREIYTTIGGDRVGFSTANVSDTDLDLQTGEISSYPNYPASGVTTLAGLHAAVVSYVEGRDTFDSDLDSNNTELRDAVLGDIFHSDVQYIGSPTTFLAHEPGYSDFASAYRERDRVVYVGANDALLHAFNAGPYWDMADPGAFEAGTGEELFAYLPGPMLPVAKYLPKAIDENGDRLVPAFLDGSLSAADAWLGTGTTKTAEDWATVLIAAFREGGAGYLALDVTDPSAGATDDHGPYPKLLWEFTHPNLGNSWSKPVMTRVKVRRSGEIGDACGANDGDGDCREQWVAIFGGGLEHTGDPNEPTYVSNPASLAWRNTSKAIFMVALDTGELIGSVQFDASGTDGPAEMLYSIPAAPAVFDIDNDGFSDVVYIGDLGGQIWKWDLSAVGIDSDADGDYDNWSAGVFFRNNPATLSGGGSHYRSFYNPPSGTFSSGTFKLAFGSSERRNILYAGDAAADDNNRFYVVEDSAPNSVGTTLLESDLVNVTAAATYVNPGSAKGYYFVAEEGEKYLGDPLIFAGYVLTVSYKPDTFPTCGPGEAYFVAFRLDNGMGFLDENGTPEAGDRRKAVGVGVPSTPRISLGGYSENDVILVTTSEGEILTLDPPARDEPKSSVLFWRQLF